MRFQYTPGYMILIKKRTDIMVRQQYLRDTSSCFYETSV